MPGIRPEICLFLSVKSLNAPHIKCTGYYKAQKARGSFLVIASYRASSKFDQDIRGTMRLDALLNVV